MKKFLTKIANEMNTTSRTILLVLIGLVGFTASIIIARDMHNSRLSPTSLPNEIKSYEGRTILTGEVTGMPVYLSAESGLGLVTVKVDGIAKKNIVTAIINLDKKITDGDKVALKSYNISPQSNFGDQFRIAEKIH